MSRFVALAACGLSLAAGGCGGGDDDSGSGAPETDLVVTVWLRGADGPKQTRHVECPGDEACEGLTPARLKPVPADVACAEIYGGPAIARVRGTLAGRPVDARFSRSDGCEIARWQRNRALFRKSAG